MGCGLGCCPWLAAPVPRPQLMSATKRPLAPSRSQRAAELSGPWRCRNVEGEAFQRVLARGQGWRQADAGPTCAAVETCCFRTRPRAGGWGSREGRTPDSPAAHEAWCRRNAPPGCTRPAMALEGVHRGASRQTGWTGQQATQPQAGGAARAGGSWGSEALGVGEAGLDP